MRESFPMRAHTLGATLLSSCSKGIVEGRRDSLGACCAAFPTWHIPRAVPHKLGDASLLRIRKITVFRECFSVVFFYIVESVALFLTPWHTHWNMLPSAGQRSGKGGPSPVLSLGVRCMILKLGIHTHGCLGYPLQYLPPTLAFTKPRKGGSHSSAKRLEAGRLLHSAFSSFVPS